jgi:hypothetical protein
VIVSDEHRYLFVELPRTGCTAIERELRASYGGRPILRKHSTYAEFLATCRPEQRDYFVFGGIRNPLDDAVSRYFKYLTDHRGRYSGRREKRRQTTVATRAVDAAMWWLSRRSAGDFPAFFRRVYFWPYDSWASQAHARFDAVIRFERIAEDFERTIRAIGLEPVRPLPVVNPTEGRNRDFASYYTPDIIPRAKRVFGPYMRRWGYEFPSAWAAYAEHRWAEVEYSALRPVRSAYWRWIRPRILGGTPR